MPINSVVLVGRLTRDVELRVTASGQDVVSFTIAVDSGRKDDQTLFMNCTAWGNQAKFLANYCKKGNLVGVEGSLRARTYDRKDGTTANVIELVCNNVQNLQPKPQTEDNSFVSDNGSSNQDDNDLSYSDDDLPF